MAVDSSANTADEIHIDRTRTSDLSNMNMHSTTVLPDTVVANDSKQTKTSTRDAVKKAKLRRERAELLRYLYNIMESNRHPTLRSDYAPSSDSESLSEFDELLEFESYDYDLKSQRRKTANSRRTKRSKRVPSKQQKFVDFCRERQTPENITLERGRKEAIRVKFYECTKQMSRDSNCREQNIARKANIDKKLRKLGLKRLEEYLRTRNSSRDNHNSNPAAERFALREENVPKEMQDMVDFLLGLQDREITPEDYEFLLRLDESVSTKTVSDHRLASLKEDKANEEHVDDVCGICMENYEVGQTRKFLPCEHAFHSNCIDTWLGQSSTKCPLDGREI